MTTWAADATRLVHRLLLLAAPAQLPADVALEALVHELGRSERSRRSRRARAAGRSRRRRGRPHPPPGSGSRRHEGDRVADETDLALGERRPWRVGDVLAGDRVPRVDHVGVQVGRGEHGVHALERPRGRRVDAHDPGPGERAPHEAGVEHPRPHDVVDEGPVAGEQALVLDPVDPGPGVAAAVDEAARVHAERLFSARPGGGQGTWPTRLRPLSSSPWHRQTRCNDLGATVNPGSRGKEPPCSPATPAGSARSR